MARAARLVLVPALPVVARCPALEPPRVVRVQAGGKGGGAPGSAGAATWAALPRALAATAQREQRRQWRSSSGGSQVGGGAGQKSTPIPVKDLPVIKEMPDPLTMKTGPKLLRLTMESAPAGADQILEDYEYGHMPPPPGNVKASTTTALRRITVSGLEADYRMLHLTFGPGEKLSFDLGLFTPVSSTAADKFPVLIRSPPAPTRKLGQCLSRALPRLRGGHRALSKAGRRLSQLGLERVLSCLSRLRLARHFRLGMGLSRAVDYLVTDASIASDKIMITGVSTSGSSGAARGRIR